MESLIDILHQVGNALNDFFQSTAERDFGLGIGILLIGLTPLSVWRAFQARKKGQIYNFRQDLWLSLVILFTGAEMFLIHLPSGGLHGLGDLIGILNIVPYIFMLCNMAGARREREEAKASQQAKALANAASPIEAWPPAPAAK